MIKFKTNSVIHSISGVQEIPSKSGGQPFVKRVLVLDDSWTGNDGTTHTNLVAIDFTGERMATLDAYAPGQMVTVEGCINGNQSKSGAIFASLRGLNIAPYAPQQSQGYGQPAPSYPQQGHSQPQTPYGQPQQGYGQPYAPQQGGYGYNQANQSVPF